MKGEGCPETLIASVLGLPRRTLRSCKADQPELAEAMAAGLAELETELVKMLIDQARGGVYSAAMFLLKTRCGYRETGPVDGGPDSRVAIQINLPEPKTVEEYMRTISGGFVA